MQKRERDRKNNRDTKQIHHNVLIPQLYLVGREEDLHKDICIKIARYRHNSFCRLNDTEQKKKTF